MNTGSRRCSTSGCAASVAWSSTWIRVALAEASRPWRPPVAGVRRSTGGSSVGLTIWSLRRRDGLPQVNPGTIVLLLVAAIGAAWAAGLIRPHYEAGRVTLRAFRAGHVFASFDFRDTGLLLLLALTMGWAVGGGGGAVPVGPRHGRPPGAGRGHHHGAWMASHCCRPFTACLPAGVDSRDAWLPVAADAFATAHRERQRRRPPQVGAGASRSNQPVAPDRLAADVRPDRVVGQLVDLSPAQRSRGPLAHGHDPGGGDYQ